MTNVFQLKAVGLNLRHQQAAMCDAGKMALRYRDIHLCNWMQHHGNAPWRVAGMMLAGFVAATV